MNTEYKQCKKCLAYYKGTHQCDWLMKMLVWFAKAKEELKADTCIRCWLSKKDVKAEGSNWCYLYGKKMAEKHMWTYDEIDDDLIINNTND